jgi:hypothetical protein
MIETNMQGFVSISTDGYPPDQIAPLLEALRGLQSRRDREADEALNSGPLRGLY